MGQKRVSHYRWLDKHLEGFFVAVGTRGGAGDAIGISGAHGDKCYTYRGQWAAAGIPFPHGVAIYLLSYCVPFLKEVRETEHGWVAPSDWVMSNYQRFSPHLPPVDETDPDVLSYF